MKLARMFFKKLVYTSCVQLFNTEKISLSVRLLEEGSLYYKSLPKNSEKQTNKLLPTAIFLTMSIVNWVFRTPLVLLQTKAACVCKGIHLLE